MKKLLATLVITGVAAAAMAQGTVSWTGVANLLIAETNSTAYNPILGGGSTGQGSIGVTVGSSTSLYYYELLTSTNLSTVPTTLAGVNGLKSWSDTGLEAQNGAAANGRILQLNASTATVAQNWNGGATQNLIFVGWSANLGTTWSAALNVLSAGTWGANSYFGIGSSVGTLAAATGNPGVVVFGSGPGQINNAAANPLVMDLLPVPEPGTMALAALGGLSLLAFRRKK